LVKCEKFERYDTAIGVAKYKAEDFHQQWTASDLPTSTKLFGVVWFSSSLPAAVAVLLNHADKKKKKSAADIRK